MRCTQCRSGVCEHDGMCSMMLLDHVSAWDGPFYVRCDCPERADGPVFPVTVSRKAVVGV